MKSFTSTVTVFSVLVVTAVAALSLMALSSVDAFTTTTPTRIHGSTIPKDSTRLYFNGDLGSIVRNWGKKATVSHILIGPPQSKTGRGMTKEDATKKLKELKDEIEDDATKFAETAKKFSSCSTSKKGGEMDPFSPGVMFKTFDKISFEEEVGKVHGPFSTPYGEHLLLIKDRQ